MTWNMTENKEPQIENDMEDNGLGEEEQGIIDALELYLSHRCPQPHPLLQWIMW